MSASVFPEFLYEPVEQVAPLLLGCELERTLGDGTKLRVRIVETEAYDQDDEASHTYRGESKRNATMFRAAGHLYVYFTYGMHHCCNVVTGVEGHGSGVLVRAVEPVMGREYIENRRGMSGVAATNGPGKVCQALAIDLALNGHDLRGEPLRLIAKPLHDGESIVSSPRIGISKARDVHRRYYIDGNPYVSRAKPSSTVA